MQVAAFGQLTVYAARGEMQFTVTRMEAEGDGLWRKALELTRARLEADGLLAPSASDRSRVIRAASPSSRAATAPRCATSSPWCSDACPAVELVVVPAAVQGDSAPESIYATRSTSVCAVGQAPTS